MTSRLAQLASAHVKSWVLSQVASLAYLNTTCSQVVGMSVVAYHKLQIRINYTYCLHGTITKKIRARHSLKRCV